MLDFAQDTEAPMAADLVRTAVVEAIDDEGCRARVTLEDAAPPSTLWAEIAVPGGGATPGARVLLAFREEGTAFVIGVLAGGPVPRERRMELADGSSVCVSEAGGAQTLRLLSDADELLMEYDTRTGRVRLNAPAGDLELVSRGGDVVLDAARSVRLSGDAIDARGRSHVHLSTADPAGRTGSVLRLDPSTARIVSPRLGLSSRRWEIHADETVYRGERLKARVDFVHVVAQRIERFADRVHESANRVYTTVRELMEVRAERIRKLVAGTYQVTVKRAFLRSKEDFKIKGDRIHLG